MGKERSFFAGRTNKSALMFILAAILLRSLIPIGYMLDYTSIHDGGSIFMICPTGLEGLVEGTFLEDSIESHEHHGVHNDVAGGTVADGDTSYLHGAPCIFAAMAVIALAFAFLGLFLSILDQCKPGRLFDNDRRPGFFLYGAHYVRGPPQQA